MTREELNAVRGYVSNIQAIKDAHNTDKLPINYGTICTITANGWKLIEELKPLEQEPCYNPDEWCHDCKEYNQEKYCCPRFNRVIRNAVEEIKQSKTGHWIMTNDYYTGAYGTIDYIKCSCCGEESLEEGDFCPNCGAKMVEPQAESE